MARKPEEALRKAKNSRRRSPPRTEAARPQKEVSGDWRVALGLVLAAFIVRLPGIAWGLPDVYEEAYPLKLALQMWNFGPGEPDLNPHFFRYPSLVIYIEFALVGILRATYGVLGLASTDEQFLQVVTSDPTPLYLAARGTVALFGALTVVPVWHLAHRVLGRVPALCAALLVTLSPHLLMKSHLVETDLPLTFFATLACAISIPGRHLQAPLSLRRVAMAGTMVGLAASAKYPGAFALIPLLFSIFLTHRGISVRVTGAATAMAASAALVAFAMTSPFVFLSWPEARLGLEAERAHLVLGHFGGGGESAMAFYANAWFGSLLGWVVGAAALVGFVERAFIRRERWAWVAGAFLLVFCILVGLWETRTDRYLLPSVPVASIFAAGTLTLVTSMVLPRPSRIAATATLLGLALLLPVGRWRELQRHFHPDTRTAAREWIEDHLAPGSYVISEPYGPRLASPLDARLDRSDRRRTAGPGKSRPVYWLVIAPMFQVGPERSATSYDPQADAWIVTSSVRDRYLSRPDHFPGQNAFYAWLRENWTEVARFRPGRGSGPEVIVYRNPEQTVPYIDRIGYPVEPTDFMMRTGGDGGEATFYQMLALNYLGFGYPEGALIAIEKARSLPAMTGGASARSLDQVAKMAERHLPR